MNFKKVPVYNSSLASEDRVINLEHLEQVKPHAEVPVDPGAVSTSCCELVFHSSTAIIVLIDKPTFETQLQTLIGSIDTLGIIS
jgi:hypothetical protein